MTGDNEHANGINKTRDHRLSSPALGVTLAALVGDGRRPAAAVATRPSAAPSHSGSVDAIQAELERAEHLVCAACTDMVRPLVDHHDSPRAPGGGLVARAARAAASVYVEMLTPALAARLAAGAQRRRRAGRALRTVGHPGAGRGAVEPDLHAEARAAMARALGSIGAAARRAADRRRSPTPTPW